MCTYFYIHSILSIIIDTVFISVNVVTYFIQLTSNIKNILKKPIALTRNNSFLILVECYVLRLIL